MWSVRGQSGEIDEKIRAKHLEGLPDGLLVEDWVVRVAVLDALEVLVLGPEGIAGTLGRVRAREEERREWNGR